MAMSHKQVLERETDKKQDGYMLVCSSLAKMAAHRGALACFD